MRADFYKLLEVNEDVGEEEIRRAFLRLARIWHPDKNLGDRKLAETMFKQISEAYQVLLDPDKRAAYDRERLAEMEAPAKAGGDGENEEMFSEPRRSIGARFGERLFRKIFGDDLEFASYRKAEPVERLLPCSLEELFNGTTKKMKISRKIVDASGQKLQVEEIQTIEIKPGSKKGERFVFPEMGDEELNVIPADLILIVDEKPHAVFMREENDLIVTRNISLVEALTGVTVYLKTLDGRQLKVDVEDVIGPGYEKTVAGEGMPAAGKGSFRRGNLRIRFVTDFPAKLTAEQKFAVRRLFAG